MNVIRKKNDARLLSLLLALCMVFSLMPTVTFAGTDKPGYWGKSVYNEHVGGNENITIAKVDENGDVAWENIAYCYNKERGYPEGEYDGSTYSNEYEYLEAQDPATWKSMSVNTGYSGDMKDILTKILFIGYPYDSNDGKDSIRNIVKNDCKVDDEYIDDVFRNATQKAVWHVTDNRGFTVPSYGAVPTGNKSAMVSNYVGKIIYERALAYTGETGIQARLWTWKGGNNRNQHLLDTGFNLRTPLQQPAANNSIKVQISAKKTIDDGNTAIGNNTFSFKLTGNGQELTATNDENGNILFPEMTYTQPGTYTYTIEEVTDDRDGVTFDFDESKKTVTVTVSSQDLQTYDPSATYYAFEETDEESNRFFYVDTTPGSRGIVMYCTDEDKIGPQDPNGYNPIPANDQTYNAFINPTISEIKSNVLVHLDNSGQIFDETNLIEHLKKLFYYLESDGKNEFSNNDKQKLVWTVTDGISRKIEQIDEDGNPTEISALVMLQKIYNTVTLPPIYNLAFFKPTETQADINNCPQPLATGYGAVVSATTNEVVFNNTSLTQTTTADVTISKVNLGGTPLAGAHIVITDEQGEKIANYTTTTGTETITVTPGTYTFHEEAAPTGYVAVTAFTFTVDENGTVTLNQVDTNVANVVDGVLVVTDQVEEEPEDVTVEISKVDLDGTPLAGAHIVITDEQGEEVANYTTTTRNETIRVTPGTYTFHEEAAPTGYVAVTDFTFTVDENGMVTLNQVDTNVANVVDGVLVVTDQYEEQTVEISKVNLGGTPLAGAHIVITDEQGEEVANYTTTTGTETITVTPGTYTFHEEAAPTGYVAVTDFTFTVDENGNVTLNQVDTNVANIVDGVLVVKDQYEEQTVEISKVDLGGTPLAGAHIQIRNAAGTVISDYTTTTGTETITVTPGTYTFHEEAAPTGYVVVTDFTFTVDENGNVTLNQVDTNVANIVDGVLVVTDQYEEQTVEISKVDLDGTPLAGAHIVITDEQGEEIANYTTTTGTETITVTPGTYTFHEEAAPTGYVAVTDFTFTVDENGNVTLNQVDTNVANIVDGVLVVTDQYEEQTVEISKVDLDGTPLAGAHIVITDEQGEEIANYTTTTRNETIRVTPGTYTFHEEAAPTGYVAVTDFTFTVDENGNVTLNQVDTNVANIVDGVLVVTDQYEEQTVEISKVNLGGTPLAGAHIVITDEQGEEVANYTTTTRNETIRVTPGTYTFHEEAAPTGYVAVTDFTFTVDENGNVTLNQVDTNVANVVDGVLVVTDQYEEQTVEISKVNLGGTPLAGAHIQIKNAAGTVISDYTTTTGTETITVAPGTYTFHEEAAPTGYVAVTDFTFTVDENGNVTLNQVDTNVANIVDGVLVVTDQVEEEPEDVTVEISKVDLDGTPLAGAHIVITDDQGEEIANYTTTTGTETITVTPGTYTFHEEAAPTGYVAVTDFTFTVDENGNVTLNQVDTNVANIVDGVLVVTDQYEEQTVEISKVNLGGTPLAGAHIVITDEQGEEIANYTTTTGTETITVTPGTYTFHEEAAPTGYLTVTDFNFTVNEDGTVELTNVASDVAQYVNGILVVTDQYEEQTVEISKVDLGGQPLAGAHIIVTDEEGNVVADYTSTTEAKTITVAPGTYTFHEEAAPEGYKVVTDFTFTVSEDGTVTVNGVDTSVAKYEDGKLIVTDETEDTPTPVPEDVTVEISKVDLGGTPLAGAHIIVTDEEGNVVADYTSTTEAKTITVAPGTYTFHEEAAPEGYKVVTDFTFTVSEDGTVTVNGVDTSVAKYEDGKLIVTDQAEEAPVPEDVTVEISKVDLGGQPLAGAHIIVTDEEGNVVADYTSTTEAKTITVAPGTYTFHEEAAPEGYKVVTDFTFTVSEDGTVTVNGVDTSVAKYEDGKLIVTDENIGGESGEENPGEDKPEKPEEKPEDGTIVSTGDDTNIMLYVLLMELSMAACVMGVLTNLKKKRNNNF